MGVTVLQQFPMVENRTGPQTIEFLTKRVMALGAVQTGQFLVDCDTFMSVQGLGEFFYILCRARRFCGNVPCAYVNFHLPI
ncbi:mediator of RNA polymerase II transcription subunit 20-like isoform X3 [Zootermopsis nevadensis]|uniref:mediator of RNA polymerase II transcription subunit 20-like isoform X3 n=1 Tax=Zootermopsis nevadensis TaxID=136037 RepID=UPI000B8EE195|nr:mediator of RNA polymerase II transcription subunit 20-like isoform X3 [Zootermopsis nevadensis]